MFNYDRFEELLKESGKKKVYLSEKINKGKTYFRDAKKQNTNIKGWELDIIAQELGTTPEYLTNQTDIKKAAPSGSGKIDELLRLAGELTPEQFERLLAYGQGMKDAEK